jgi:hypothetical protein
VAHGLPIKILKSASYSIIVTRITQARHLLIMLFLSMVLPRLLSISASCTQALRGTR